MSRPPRPDTQNLPRVAAPAVDGACASRTNVVQHAIEELFNGDTALYERFRAMTLPRLREEVEKADSALAGEDFSALAGVMHNLKSVLRLIGQADESEWAQNLDVLARQGNREACVASWAELRTALQSLYAQQGSDSE